MLHTELIDLHAMVVEHDRCNVKLADFDHENFRRFKSITVSRHDPVEEKFQ